MANLPFWLEAGLAEAPQANPIFPPPRGSGRMPLPNYDQIDPFELAALRQRETVRPSGGRYWDDQTPIALATSALDPLGITSFIAGQVSPETRDLIRSQYEGRPIAQTAGALISGGPVSAATRSAIAPVAAAIKAAPKTMASILGIGGGAISAGEAGEVDDKSPPAGVAPPDAVIDQKLLDKQGALEEQINDKDAAFEKKLGNYRTRSERQAASQAHSESMAGLRDQLKDINKQPTDRMAEDRSFHFRASRRSHACPNKTCICSSAPSRTRRDGRVHEVSISML